MSKVISSDYAVSLIKDDITLGVGSFIGFGTPEELLVALEKRYILSREPKNLKVIYSLGSVGADRHGLNRMGHEGLIKRIICPHIEPSSTIGRLCIEDKIECFIIPPEACNQLLRSIGQRQPELITNAGLSKCVDPRFKTEKANDTAKSSEFQLVQLMDIYGEKHIPCELITIDVCFIKGTYADEDGNISLTEKLLHSDQLEMAMATHASGGIVIAQVQSLVKNEFLEAPSVQIPGCLVDYIVVEKAAIQYDK